MQLYVLIVLAVGLAGDACAAAICKGLATPKLRLKHMLITGLWFGGFQAVMPVIGYIPVKLLGPAMEKYITNIDHWVAFSVLAFLGVKMIYEAITGGEEECVDCSFAPRAMVVMAVATSIDALAVGVTFALTDANIFVAALLIGVITFVLSALGVKIGNVFGVKYKKYAELAGGAVLVLIGLKILLEHLGVIAF
ncbi:MAG: manganese efflux pump [Clostridia bacterium]|nr:manganese efflux pump [Clostridia bacterium]